MGSGIPFQFYVNKPVKTADDLKGLKLRCSATLIPFLLEGVAGIPDLNLPDGIHPNVEGHQIVADNVWRVLQKML